ncbi:MAG: ABC transporter permease subunit [Methylothermaceae bacterium]|nr:ABC transporter permease subunit [Methylothermaceae bacterium]
MSTRLINRRPGRVAAIFIGLLPFIFTLLAYLVASDIRLHANPDDKLLPGLQSFADAVLRLATEPSRRTGEILWWADTVSSLRRLFLGLGVAALLGLGIGMATGMLPWMRAGLAPFVRVLSMIPPLALLPILFIVFGLGELSKVVLIIFGVSPFIMRDIQARVEELPNEQLIKAQTLGASSWQMMTRVVLPQVLPRLLEALRLSLGPAWLFLIAAEAIASTDGLGYRIFLMRRYLAMDVILPYVAWITLLAYLTDLLLRQASRRLFPWFQSAKEGA